MYPATYHQKSLKVLQKAIGGLSAYSEWRDFDPGSAFPLDVRFASLPVLTKADIRKHFPHGFVPSENDLEKGLQDREIEFVETSGSSDIAVTNIWYQPWWDASEKTSWKLNSHAQKLTTTTHREAILVNPVNVGLRSDDRPLTISERRVGRFLYLNEKTDTGSWTADHMDLIAGELSVYQPHILEASPSLLARLCRYLAKKGKPVYQPGLIILTYELPSILHLQQIKLVFSCPVASSYGSTETGYVFMQCEQGKFHHVYESCRVDFQPLLRRQGEESVGRILVTPFDNPWYYLLRFYIGDLVKIDMSQRCACGRNDGLILESTEGRVNNITTTQTGTLLTVREVDNVIGHIPDIDEYRIEQQTQNKYEIKIVSGTGNKQGLKNQVLEALKELYGSASEIDIIFAHCIPPEASGKYCLTTNLVPLDYEKFFSKG